MSITMQLIECAVNDDSVMVNRYVTNPAEDKLVRAQLELIRDNMLAKTGMARDQLGMK